MRIHANHGYLDGASKVEVVVAQVIGRGLKLILSHRGCIVNHLVQHWLCGGDCGFVRDQVEVKLGVALAFNDCGVNYSSWARIQAILSLFYEKTMLNVAIDQAVDNLRLVARG